MPIEGKLYSSKELQAALVVSRQRVHNLGKEQGWGGPLPGAYWAEDVEPYLLGRNIDPNCLPVFSYEYPEGATQQQMADDFMAAYEAMEATEDE